MNKNILVLFCFLLLIQPGKAQDSTAHLTFAAYGEVYYAYDFSRPNAHTRPPFVYNHNRTSEVTVNLALIRASFTREKARAHIGVMAGTYSNANLAAEPGVLKNLYEANAGVRISKRHQLWIDAGILPSHIGFESAIGKNNRTLTRSIAAENSPYYEAGMRLSYSSADEKWYTALLLLNGWQRIQRKDGNSSLAAGSQVTFKPNPKVTLNASTFAGNEQPDSTRRMRYFHNLYGIVSLTNRIEVSAGFDTGIEQKQKGSSAMNFWFTPVIIFRNMLSPAKHLAIRGEYYQDKQGVIIPKINGWPFRVWSCSSNFDWLITANTLWRTEVRWMRSKHPVFVQQNGTFGKENAVVTTALCFSF